MVANKFLNVKHLNFDFLVILSLLKSEQSRQCIIACYIYFFKVGVNKNNNEGLGVWVWAGKPVCLDFFIKAQAYWTTHTRSLGSFFGYFGFFSFDFF